MNRYIIQGILQDLTNGRDVLVVDLNLTQARRAHDAVIGHLHANGVADRYRWPSSNGSTWIRDKQTGAAATFTSLQSTTADHTDADVLVVNNYRGMIDGPKVWGATGPNKAAFDRIRELADQCDTVLID